MLGMLKPGSWVFPGLLPFFFFDPEFFVMSVMDAVELRFRLDLLSTGDAPWSASLGAALSLSLSLSSALLIRNSSSGLRKTRSLGSSSVVFGIGVTAIVSGHY